MDSVLEFVSEALILQAFGVVLGVLILRFIMKLVFDRLEKVVQKQTKNKLDDILVHAARKPSGWLIVIYGVLFAADILQSAAPVEIFQFIPTIREITLIVLLSWFAIRIVKGVEENNVIQADPEDLHTVQGIAKLLRVSVIITSGLICLQTLGFSVEGVLAFGGIGGLAVGFAAKDILANFFGAIMLYLDKPFAVGDWIRSPDQEIEGVVERIGWRVTMIRTFDKRPLYIPNATFSNLSVENPSRMSNRRIKETIGVRYDDILVLPKILGGIREMLQMHPEIDTKQILMVNLNYFNESSVDFFIYTFTKTTDWAFFHEIKEDVLFKINEIVEKHGGEIAFPTRTVHVVPQEVLAETTQT